MKHNNLKPYLYGMLAGFGSISLSLLFFFLLYRYQGFGDALNRLLGILAPFIYGAVIAYLLKPMCSWFDSFLSKHLPEKLKKSAPPLSVALSILVGLLIVYALFIMIIPQLSNSVITLVSTMPDKFDQFMVWLEATFGDNPVLLHYIDAGYSTLTEALDSWVKNTMMPYMKDVLSGVGLSVWNAVIAMKNVLIGIIVAVYLLASRHKFSRQSKLLLYSVVKPEWAKLFLEELRYADRMFEGFINGKILDSAIIGLLCYIISVIVGFPNALLISAIIGVTNIIPFFGPFVGAVPATLLIFIEDPIKALWFVVFVLILQQVDGNILGPKILGNTTGLSSFWVLFAILLFGGLWGFVGMIIGVPLFAVIYDVTRKLVRRGLSHNRCGELLTQYDQDFPPEDSAAAKTILAKAAAHHLHKDKDAASEDKPAE